jgi:hypothetical protein
MVRVNYLKSLYNLNQHASEIKVDPIPYWEDSPQLAAGYASILIEAVELNQFLK